MIGLSPIAEAEINRTENGRAPQKDAIKEKIALLLERWDHGDEIVKNEVRREIESMGPVAVSAFLEDACSGVSSPRRDNHYYYFLSRPALKEHTVNQLYPVLMKDLSPFCWTNAQALMEAARGSEREKYILSRFLEHPDASIRGRALENIQHLKVTVMPAVDLIAAGLADKQECIRWRSWVALKEMGGPAVPALIMTLEHKQASTRRLAAETLGRIGPPAKDAKPALILRLKDDTPVVRSASLEALRQIGEPKEQIIAAIASSLTDRDPYVRETAVSLLGLIGRDAKNTAPLLKTLKDGDSDESVRDAASWALKAIGPTTVLEYLVKYYYFILFVLAAGLVCCLFLRTRQNIPKTLYGIVCACFGHPIYVTLAAYITYRIGLVTGQGGNESQVNIIGFITVLLVLFLLRFVFFLYVAWINTRSPLSAVLPHAANAFYGIHKYCVFGLPWCAAFMVPIEGNVFGFIYFPLIFLTGVAGLVQSSFSLGQATFPERWAPSDEIVVLRKQEDVELPPLPQEELQWRRRGKMLIACLSLLIAGAVTTAVMTSGQDRKDTQEDHFRRMLARENPGTAKYHHMLGEKYAGVYPVNTSMNREEGYAKALEEYNKAIALDPNLSRAYRNRGYAYMGLKDYLRALDDFNSFERLSDVVDSRFYGDRARAYEALGMKDKMCEDYQRSCCGPVCVDYKRKVEEGLCKDWRQ